MAYIARSDATFSSEEAFIEIRVYPDKCLIREASTAKHTYRTIPAFQAVSEDLTSDMGGPIRPHDITTSI